MTAPLAAAAGGEITHLEHLPTILAYKATLPAEPRPVRGGTFPGGMVWAIADDHYVAILLPPHEAALRRMQAHFGEHYDGEWLVLAHEGFGSIEAVHLTPPWAA